MIGNFDKISTNFIKLSTVSNFVEYDTDKAIKIGLKTAL